MLKHVQEMKYDDEPDYGALFSMFTSAMHRLDISELDAFEWEMPHKSPQEQQQQPKDVASLSVKNEASPATRHILSLSGSTTPSAMTSVSPSPRGLRAQSVSMASNHNNNNNNNNHNNNNNNNNNTNIKDEHMSADDADNTGDGEDDEESCDEADVIDCAAADGAEFSDGKDGNLCYFICPTRCANCVRCQSVRI